MMDLTTARITVAGCGSMGLPMALRLRAGGFPVSGFDIRRRDEFGDFAGHMLSGPEEISASDVLISVVRDAGETRALCFDEQAVFRQGDYPRILVICSTLSPRFIHDLVDRLPGDVTLLDAPMSGAPYSAEQGNLSFMLGGEEDAVGMLMPLFHCMGGRVFRAGASGAGMTLKVLNNYVAASSVVAVRRVYDLAAGLGVDRSLLQEVMSASSGSTWYGDNFDDISWSRQGYGKGNTIGILEKDVLSALDVAGDPARDQDLTRDRLCQLDQALLDALRALEAI
jgi:3-hydroxyisobutyrate dehydrogenase-like beta-hydroxyacid dehydrogenase